MAPPTKPHELRLLDGTFRASRHKVPGVAETLAEVPPAPEGLSELGASEWAEKGEALKKVGLLQGRYLECLRRYCMAAEQYAIAAAEVDRVTKEKQRFFKTEKGFIVAHPALKDMKDWDARCKLYLTEMGLTPASSSKTPACAPKTSAVRTRDRIND